MPDTRQPSRFSRHYCRECETRFEHAHRAPEGAPPISPHLRFLAHMRRTHGQATGTYCSKNCTGREQSEERSQGQKLYGPGRVRTTPIMTHDELFPDDNEHI